MEERRSPVSRLLTSTIPAAIAVLLLAAGPLCGQQTYVTRFDVSGGYMYFNSPQVGLPEHGFDLQGGVRLLRWLTVGFDYTRAEGDLTLTPGVLPSSLQQTLSAALA